MRRPFSILAAGLVLTMGVWGAIWTVREWQFQRELRQAEHEFKAGRFQQAGARLARLAQSRPGLGDVAYLLGACERIAGHAEAALEAWGRVPDQAKEAQIAAFSRGRLAREKGRERTAGSSRARASGTGRRGA